MLKMNFAPLKKTFETPEWLIEMVDETRYDFRPGCGQTYQRIVANKHLIPHDVNAFAILVPNDICPGLPGNDHVFTLFVLRDCTYILQSYLGYMRPTLTRYVNAQPFKLLPTSWRSYKAALEDMLLNGEIVDGKKSECEKAFESFKFAYKMSGERDIHRNFKIEVLTL